MSEEERARAQKQYEDVQADIETRLQQKIDAACKLIKDQKITHSPNMPRPLAPGTVMKNAMEVETNLFGIRMNDDFVIFKYDIGISTDTGRKIIDFTRRGKTDRVASDRLRTCMLIFDKAIKLTGNHSEELVFFYDGQAIMYSTEKLIFHGPHTRSSTVTLDGSAISNDLKFFKEIRFVIKECADRFQSRLSDIRNINRSIVTKDRTALQFLDIASNLHALTQCHTRFAIFANGKIFPIRPDLEGIQTVPMKEGKVLIPGMSKSIKLVEGPRGRDNASPALAIDSLRVVFHEKGPLLEKARGVFADMNRPAEMECNAFSLMVKGLGCSTTHMKEHQRVIECDSLSKFTAVTKKIEVDLPEQETRTFSIAEFFKWKYDIDLRYPHAYLVAVRERGKVNLYPIEVLDVIPMQRVTIPQTTSAQSQVATKECAVPPGARQNAIVAQCQLHEFFNPEQKFLKAAGIEVIATPLRTTARVLKCPVLKYKNSEMEVVQPAWKPPMAYQFLVPSSCDKWAMYGILNPNDAFGLADVNRFAAAFVKTCKMRGMQIKLPDVVDLIPTPPQGKSPHCLARAKIREAAESKIKFVYFITSDSITIHEYIKLQESYTKTVVTQDMRLKTAINFLQKNQSLTMDNIVSKTNVKLGGVNYSINLKNVVGGTVNPFDGSRLVIGIGLSHAPPCANYHTYAGVKLESPTVVGYSANMGNLPTEYIGDFLYQNNKKDDLLVCGTELLQNVLDRYTGVIQPDGTRGVLKKGDPTPKPMPKEMIVFRQGVSEGYYAMCIEEEIPLFKAILAANGAADCKLTYITVHKEHNTRLMPRSINTADKPTVQNIGSGVVIDTQLTHPRNREFFLNSHLTLQGTARTPRYTVLYDDQDITMNELESLTHALAFNFQIVNSPVSVPAPLYIANRYAERGVAIFQAKANDDKASSEQRMRTSIEDMNEDLTYFRKPLGAARINA